MNKVNIKNQMGMDLSALEFLPKDFSEDGKYPVLIVFHGFLGFKEQRHIVSMCETANELGWVGYAFDLRGSGESYGTFENEYRITNFVEDLNNLIEHFKSKNWCKEVHLSGHSMGGQTAIIVASMRSDIISVVASQSPYDLFGDGSWGKRLASILEPIGFYINYSPRLGVIKLPRDFFNDAIKWNALKYVRKLKIPSLFIVGDWDFVIPKEQTQKMFKLAGSKQKKLVNFNKMDHEYRFNKFHVNNVRKELLEFWGSIT